jgi:TRAP-type C4-dicarboxylate transport system permease large subunit
MTMEEVSLAALPFLLICLLGLILITAFPGISLFLPKLFMG